MFRNREFGSGIILYETGFCIQRWSRAADYASHTKVKGKERKETGIKENRTMQGNRSKGGMWRVLLLSRSLSLSLSFSFFSCIIFASALVRAQASPLSQSLGRRNDPALPVDYAMMAFLPRCFGFRETSSGFSYHSSSSPMPAQSVRPLQSSRRAVRFCSDLVSRTGVLAWL